MSRGGAKREGDTESEAGSRLWAISTEPAQGLNSWTVRSWPEPKSDVQRTEPPRCSLPYFCPVAGSANSVHLWMFPGPLIQSTSERPVSSSFLFCSHWCSTNWATQGLPPYFCPVAESTNSGHLWMFPGPLIQSTHSSTQQMSTEDLLCDRHCSRLLEYNAEQKRQARDGCPGSPIG